MFELLTLYVTDCFAVKVWGVRTGGQKWVEQVCQLRSTLDFRCQGML
ncbi:hypothetical protein [Plectonema phage JingP1]|uniref:Uncharacterized protein n=1 Tax=Plectonema phage JingP1 TaxID=2961687 RepID=A0A9E7NPF3_9CAUD|nr:hypothetical protein [Plectonema phage JingP1]